MEMYDTEDEAILAPVPRGHEHGTHYVVRVAARTWEPSLGEVFTRDALVAVTDEMRMAALERQLAAADELERAKKARADKKAGVKEENL
jgi:hypothetical protein